jgi:hypothetical protein
VSTRSFPFYVSAGLALVLLALLYAQDAPLRAGFGLDTYHHLAAVRELAKGEFPPQHNLVAGRLPQGHYGPYLVALGALSRFTRASPKTVLYLAGVSNLLLFVLAFRAVTLRLLGPGPALWSVAAPLLLLGPWPRPGVLWPAAGWPGTTSLGDSQNFFYPNTVGLSLLLLVLARCLPPAPDGGRGAPARAPAGVWVPALTLLLAATLLATHPLSGVALAVTMGALGLSLLIERRAPLPHVIWLLALPAAALGLAALWPYYPVLGLLHAFALPALREPLAAAAAPAAQSGPIVVVSTSLPILETLGPATLGLAYCFYLAGRGRFFLLLWSTASLALAVFPIVPLHQRFLFYSILPLQIAATGLLDASWRAGRGGRAFALVILGAGALSSGLRAHQVLAQELPDLAFVDRLTPKDAVILTDPLTANGVAGLTGRKVVIPANPDIFLMMGDAPRRSHDVRTFREPSTTAEMREAIRRRWDVSHVLVDRAYDPDLPALPYPVLYEGGGYVLYDVSPGPGAGASARNTQRARPNRTSSPWLSSLSAITRSPFTRVKFVDPRSCTT